MSIYSITWLCAACGEPWDESGTSKICLRTPECQGHPIGMAFYEREGTPDEAVTLPTGRVTEK